VRGFQDVVHNLTSLGIVAALKSEARTLANRPLPAGVSLQLKDHILLKVSGLGAKRAGAAADSLLAEGATALLSWGCAGGLAASLVPGNLILPRTIISADQSVVPADVGWHERLCRILRGYKNFHTGPLAESPTVLSSAAEKRTFSEKFDAIAVDMESASVARTARHAQVPFIAIRAVADPLEMSIPLSALEAINDDGRLQLLKLLHGLARNPAELFLLIRLNHHFRKARTTLATIARLAGDHLFGLQPVLRCMNPIQQP
jgi:adenosylhomocysteine nucleosidase